jgi:hypothetical protein
MHSFVVIPTKLTRPCLTGNSKADKIIRTDETNINLTTLYALALLSNVVADRQDLTPMMLLMPSSR